MPFGPSAANRILPKPPTCYLPKREEFNSFGIFFSPNPIFFFYANLLFSDTSVNPYAS